MQQVLISSIKYRNYMEKAQSILEAQGIALIPHTEHRGMTEERLIQMVEPAAALISGPEPVTARVMDAAPLLKIVVAPGVGYDHIDTSAARARGIPVATCPGCNHHAVAEMALGMMFSLARHIALTDRNMRAGQWGGKQGIELWGKTLGIVGLGAIGKALAVRAGAMGMRLLAADSYRDLNFATQNRISFVGLEQLLHESDFVSLHLPMSAQTRGLINTETLRLMKPTAYLINTARGGLIDQSALVEALRNGVIGGAGLDVFEVEPPNPNPFIEFDNVIMASHSAGATAEAVDSALELALQNIINVLQGGAPQFVVN